MKMDFSWSLFGPSALDLHYDGLEQRRSSQQRTCPWLYE